MSLFESFKLGHVTIKNRILVPPHLEGLAQKSGRVSHAILDQLVGLARQGAGTVILGPSYVTQQGKSHLLQLGIAEEEHLPGLTSLVKLLKNEGACVGIRLQHAGAKTSEKITKEQPISPSPINFGKDYDLSRSFDEDDVNELCLFYSHAIERAYEAGIDFVELNGAQQMLLDQCLHLRFNQRDDHYGGTLENRLRLACRIIKSMRERIGNKVMISYFFSIHDKLEDNFGREDLRTIMNLLEAAGVDIFHPVTIHVMNKFFDNEETLVELGSKFTDKPIIVEGNIKSTQVLKEILALDKSTMYSLDKALLTRPNWFQFLQKKIAG